MNKEPRITLEEQVEQNRVNIESQIALTDTNTTDIAELKNITDDLNADKGDIPIGSAGDLLTTDKDSIVDSINEVKTQADSNTTRVDGQDIAINSLANNVKATKNAYSEISTSGVVATTATFIKTPTVIEASTDTDILTLTETAGYTEFYVKTSARIEFIYKFNAIEAVGTTPELVVELIDTVTNDIIKTDTVIIDFAGTANVSSGINTLSASVSDKKLAVKVYTKAAGNSINITSANIKINVIGSNSIVEVTNDTNVASTNNLGSSTDVHGDIQWLNTNKANQSSLDALQTQVNNIVVPDTASLEARVEALEAIVADLQAVLVKIYTA